MLAPNNNPLSAAPSREAVRRTKIHAEVYENVHSVSHLQYAFKNSLGNDDAAEERKMNAAHYTPGNLKKKKPLFFGKLKNKALKWKSK